MMWQIEKCLKFQNLGHGEVVISVSLELVSMHIYVKYEGHTGWRGNYREKRNWLAF